MSFMMPLKPPPDNFMLRFNIRVSSAFALGVLLPVLLLAGGCTTFNHDWVKAAGQPPADDLQGRWQGVWASEANGHTDTLRCVVTRKKDGTYHARFHAKYRKVLSFGYAVPLKAERTAGEFKFHGEADLGWLAGGLYRYDGTADRSNFFSTYSCKYDHGTFQMKRPGEATEK